MEASQAIHRTRDDETEDQNRALEGLLKENYHDWPNEAAFDGLTEHRGPIEIPVKGSIPAWAAGSLFRTGPGQCKIENTPKGTLYLSHWFDGLAHTHRFDIVPVDTEPPSETGQGPEPTVGAKVIYSSRRQSDELVEHIQKQGMGNMYSFGQKQDPCIGVFAKFMSTFRGGPPSGDARKLENVSVTVQPSIPGLSSEEEALGSGAPSGSDVPATAKGTNGATNGVATNGNGVAANGNGAAHNGSATSGASKTPSRASGHRVTSVWLASDTCSFREIDSRTLEPIGFATQESLHPDLSGPLSCAHSQRDPVTGDFFNFNLDVAFTSTYRVFCVSAATGKTEILATIKDLLPAYIHSFFLTAHFVVLCIPSSHYGQRGLKIPWERNMLDAIEPFHKKKLRKWLVVDRHHGQGVVAEFTTPAGFHFHTVNAFEDLAEGKADSGKSVDVFCDLVEFSNLDILHSLEYDVLLDRNGKAKAIWGDEKQVRNLNTALTRWKFRVPLPAAPAKGRGIGIGARRPQTLKPEKLFAIPGPHAGELPTINPAYHTRRHRYVYALPNRGQSLIFDTIVKTDTLTREALLWNNPRGHTPGEPIFVARPGAVDEDDGVLLSVVLDGFAGTSYLLCLDARTMTELGRAEAPFAIGLGFHGVHVRG